MPFSEDQGYYETSWMREKPGDQDRQILSRKMDDRYIYSRFKGLLQPQLKVLAAGTLNATGGGAATGAAGDENYLRVGHDTFEYHILGTQTILYPQKAATGLDIGMDQTDNDGVELGCGIVDGTPCAFKVGTDAAFFVRVKASIADVSGTDDFCVGFRKAEDYQANVDDYDEAAWLGQGQGAAGRINIETIKNAAATVTTNTTDTWADAATHTFEVLVSATGVVTYKIDGAAPTTTAAYTFDDAEIVVPFVYFLHATDLAGAVVLQEYECGFQV